MDTKHHGQDSRSGVALITVMCFAFIIATLSAMLLKASAFHVRMAHEVTALEQATYVAQAGMEKAAHMLATGTTPPYSFHGTNGRGVYCVVIIDGATPSAGWHSIGGDIAINPNSSPDAEFELTLPGGTLITMDDLKDSYAGYVGAAVNIVVRPKGGGMQNGILMDGVVYPIDNSRVYEIDSINMRVNLFNDNVNKQGKAVGRWHIAVASTAADMWSDP
jgi:hypothetical protein